MTQKQKTKVKQVNSLNLELQNAIRLKCFDCLGFLADGFEGCSVSNCPLFEFRLTRGNLSSKKFIASSKALQQKQKE